jgi:DNA-binding protein Fis
MPEPSDHDDRAAQQALEIAHGNQTRAAQLLAISRDQLRYRMLKFGFQA